MVLDLETEHEQYGLLLARRSFSASWLVLEVHLGLAWLGLRCWKRDCEENEGYQMDQIMRN
jgi:hypothetical protein